MSTGYYEHEADFECDPIEEYMFQPDIKRIITHGNHAFRRRLYFFSPSTKQVVRFLNYEFSVGTYLKAHRQGKSLIYNLIADDGKHDALCVSDKMLARTAGMTKLVLPKLK